MARDGAIEGRTVGDAWRQELFTLSADTAAAAAKNEFFLKHAPIQFCFIADFSCSGFGAHYRQRRRVAE